MHRLLKDLAALVPTKRVVNVVTFYLMTMKVQTRTKMSLMEVKRMRNTMFVLRELKAMTKKGAKTVGWVVASPKRSVSMVISTELFMQLTTTWTTPATVCS